MVPIDNSDTAHKALQIAVELAKEQNAKLQIIHIIDEQFLGFGSIYIDFNEVIKAFKKSGEDLLQAKAEIAKKENIDFECKLVELKPLENRVANKIIDEASDWSADLIVIGSHGRRGVSRMFLGSVAENVMRIASVPVLLVHAE
jgi:nucleotide-binding universal stress UspA family protein